MAFEYNSCQVASGSFLSIRNLLRLISFFVRSFFRRFDRSLQQVKERVSQGQIGLIQSVRISASYSPLPPPEYLLYTGITKIFVFHNSCDVSGTKILLILLA